MHEHQILLGASMYVPATHAPDNLVAIGNGAKYPALRSVIFCTEDSVREDEVGLALSNLTHALPKMNDSERPMRFIRVRNPHILGECIMMPGIAKIDGFVLPKVTCENLNHYVSQLRDKDTFLLMPTLETREVFDAREMTKLRQMLSDNKLHDRILCLRIGGNDLLNCLRVRRSPAHTIYDTPIGNLIARLSGEFIPHGFGLTAPVCESIDNDEVLRAEIERDLLHGLFGKTAIHPDQIRTIEEMYQVDPIDLQEAQAIVDTDAKAVFRLNNRMCEPATHTPWAHDIIKRAQIYGVRGEAASNMIYFHRHRKSG